MLVHMSMMLKLISLKIALNSLFPNVFQNTWTFNCLSPGK